MPKDNINESDWTLLCPIIPCESIFGDLCFECGEKAEYSYLFGLSRNPLYTNCLLIKVNNRRCPRGNFNPTPSS